MVTIETVKEVTNLGFLMNFKMNFQDFFGGFFVDHALPIPPEIFAREAVTTVTIVESWQSASAYIPASLLAQDGPTP